MPDLKPIEIDFEIHRMIESERKGFDEPPYLALRRLLGLAAVNHTPAATDTRPNSSNGTPWVEGKVALPHGTQVRMEYDRGRQVYEGEISNGKWVVDGRTFDSPSGAASALAVTKRGKPTSLNGWLYWKVCRPGQDMEWVPLKSLQPEVVPASLKNF